MVSSNSNLHERMKKLLKNYALFLAVVGKQFSEAAKTNKAGCMRGCHDCCKGFFGISLLDALQLRKGLGQMPAAVRRRVVAQAWERIELLEERGIFSLTEPVLKSASAVDSLARKSSGMRCPALDNRNRCVLYGHRPLLCRTFGPTVRAGRRSIAVKGCGHFAPDLPEADFPILSFYKDEEVLLRSLLAVTGKKRMLVRETIIPAALVLDMEQWL